MRQAMTYRELEGEVYVYDPVAKSFWRIFPDGHRSPVRLFHGVPEALGEVLRRGVVHPGPDVQQVPVDGIGE